MQRGLTCGNTIPVPPAAAAPSPPLLRRLSRRSLFPLRAPPRRPPASASRKGRHYAFPPSRPPASPSSLRPPPPSPPRRRRRRHRRRRLLLRAPLVFIESKQASWRQPPPPASERPDRRRRSNIRAAHWPPPPGATIWPRGGVAPRTPLPRPRPFTPALGAVSRPGALRGRRSRLSSRFARCSFAASCLSALNAAPSFTQLFFCLGLSALISRLPSVFPIFLSFVGPVNHVEIGISFQTCDLSRYLDLPKDETVHREQSHNSSCLKCAEKVNS